MPTMPPISPSPRPYSNRSHRDTQESRLHQTTIPPNHFFTHPTTTLQLRLNHPSWRIQERFRHNHPTSVILQLQPQNSAADSPRIKVLYTRSAVECAGDCGGRGRTRPRDSRPRRGRRAGRRLKRRAFAKAGRCGTFAAHRPRRCRAAA